MKNRFNEFNEFFFADIDSWFSADIACCNNCYDDFINKWPAIYRRDLQFQKNSIDLSEFYRGSRLKESFTQDEFDNYVHIIKCPRCSEPLDESIVLYNFKFDMPNDFEYELENLTCLYENTPFMLLKNDYVKKVYKELELIYKSTQEKVYQNIFYRGRDYTQLKKYSEKDFTAPPREKAEEERYNHFGIPALYISTSTESCYYELNTPKNGIMVASFKIFEPLKILDLIDNEYIEDTLLETIVWSSCMSSERIKENEYYNPTYIFTRFISDCAKYLGFDGIRYASIKLGSGENFVLFNKGQYGSNLSIIEIEKYEDKF